MSFRLVPNSATLNDLEHCVISLNLVNLRGYIAENDLWRNLCNSLLYF